MKYILFALGLFLIAYSLVNRDVEERESKIKTQIDFNMSVLERLEKLESITESLKYRCHTEYRSDGFNVQVCKKE